LPTFNSGMIELYIPNIPNLGEHFLFSNDDMFFGNYVKPSDFYDKSGNPIIRVVKDSFDGIDIFNNYEFYAQKKREWQWDVQCAKINYIIFKNYKNKYFCRPWHQTVPFRKSFIQDNLTDLAFK